MTFWLVILAGYITVGALLAALADAMKPLGGIPARRWLLIITFWFPVVIWLGVRKLWD